MFKTLGALVELTPFEKGKTMGTGLKDVANDLAPIEELDYLTLKMFTVPKANLKRAMK